MSFMFTDCCSEGASGEGVGLGGMGEEVSWGWLTGGRKVEAGRLSVSGGVAGGVVQLVSVSSVIIREKMVFLISTRQSGRAGCYVKKFRSQPRTKTSARVCIVSPLF